MMLYGSMPAKRSIQPYCVFVQATDLNCLYTAGFPSLNAVTYNSACEAMLAVLRRSAYTFHFHDAVLVVYETLTTSNRLAPPIRQHNIL